MNQHHEVSPRPTTSAFRSTRGETTQAPAPEPVSATFMDVEFVRWPLESVRLARLVENDTPRLLLVEGDQMPPITSGLLEDWIRIPAKESDIRSRVVALSQAGQAASIPEIDSDGVLRYRGKWAALPPIEKRLVQTLLDNFGAVVSRDLLTEAGWPGADPGRNALDVHMLRLRRRTSNLDLAIRTVRSRGYLLEAPSESRRNG